MSRRSLTLITHYSLLITLAGCSPHRAAPPAHPSGALPGPPAAAPPDPWIIRTTAPGGAYRPTYLGNGYLGQVMDAGGLVGHHDDFEEYAQPWTVLGLVPQNHGGELLGMTGSGAAEGGGPAAAAQTGAPGASGPQPASMAGLYEKEQLLRLPPVFPLRVEMGGQLFGADPAKLAEYSQTLDMKRGLLTTRATWNGQPVEITAFLSRDDPGLAVCHVVVPPAVRVAEAQSTGGAAAGGGATASVPSAVIRFSRLVTPDGPAPSGTVSTTLLTSMVRRGGTERNAGRELQQGLPSLGGGEGLFAALLKRHTAAWEKLWASDIEIEGSPADQQLVHALLYQVLASVRAGVQPAPGFPPMGLSNPAAFGGHVFWDADTWIFPALLPLHPELARTLLEYRFRTLPGAKANAAAEGKKGASYAWESAETGREVATLETRHGRHVSADVAMAQWNYYLATGDRAWLRERAWPVLSATADYWISRAQKNGQGRWEIRRVSTPDENAGLVDNSAWTNFGARQNLRDAAQTARLLGLSVDPRWMQVADGLIIPRDSSGMILEYSGYQGRPAKQADTLLLLFPGEMPLPKAEQERMFRYYVDRTIRNGPAMTESVHAVIAARLGQPEEAYRRFRQSVDPFVRPPFFSFSEKRTRDNMQFLTGAAGSLQAILYGFAGLRLEDSPTPVFHPQLPPAWTGLTLHNLFWRGRRYDLVVRRGQPVGVSRR